MKESVKITFTGDIMCEKPLQRAYDRYGAAAFGRVFAGTKELLGASDLAAARPRATRGLCTASTHRTPSQKPSRKVASDW